MILDDIRALLTQRQAKFTERPIEHGTQFRCTTGEVINVYDSGRVVVQGTRTPLGEAVRHLVEGATTESAPVPAATDDSRSGPPTGLNRSVFIAYGHDQAARDALELLLRRLGMDPIVLQNLPAAGDTIIEKLERYIGEHGNVGFACVLLTPDDEGYKAGRSEEKKYRARQNVVLELGMVLSKLGRRRVAIIHKQSVEQPSDIAGLIYIPFNERVDEVKALLFRELQNAGFNPRADAL